MRRLKIILNEVHEALTTAKSFASGFGSTITAVGTGLSAALGAEVVVVVAILAVGSTLTSFATWKLPYKPFELEN